VTPAAYETIDRDLAELRQPDPRIAARVEAALGSARTVISVGAGTGTYEPSDRLVLAVEPSAERIFQRPMGAARAVQGRAECLRFGEASFDTAMAMLSVHRFDDLAVALKEMRRVARRRIVILTFDPAIQVWPHYYWPELGQLARETLPPITALLEALPNARVEPVLCPRACRNGFYRALWDRPEHLLDLAVRGASPDFAGISDRATDLGVSCLRSDLADGSWVRKYGHLLSCSEADIGLRLVVSEICPESA
jgi:SAM-dependent methyltransferase